MHDHSRVVKRFDFTGFYLASIIYLHFRSLISIDLNIINLTLSIITMR